VKASISKRRAGGLLGGAWMASWLLGACSGSDFSSSPTAGGSGGSSGGDTAGSNSTSAGHAGQTSSAQADGGDATNVDEGGAAAGGGGGEPDASAAGQAAVGGSASGSGGGGGGAGGGTAGASAGAGGKGGSGGGGGSPTIGAKAFSDFVASAEGWTITGDPTVTVPLHSVTGGNLDGMINASDTGTGVWFFTAPAKFYGDISAFAGGVLRYDLKVTAIDVPFDYADVQLTTTGLTLVYDLPAAPTTSWKTYTVPLSAAGWRVATFDGVAATAQQFAQVLSNLTRLRIRGEYNNGVDTGYLDNVYLGSK
jgi:hypothetical protein